QFPFTSCQISSGNCGPNGNSRPLFASAICDGNTDPTNVNDPSCMRPVGDASNIIHGSQTFYGDAGEYALLRRMTTFASGQTIPRDTDWFAPKQTSSFGAAGHTLRHRHRTSGCHGLCC